MHTPAAIITSPMLNTFEKGIHEGRRNMSPSHGIRVSPVIPMELCTVPPWPMVSACLLIEVPARLYEEVGIYPLFKKITSEFKNIPIPIVTIPWVFLFRKIKARRAA